MIGRLRAMVIKELWALFRDRRTRAVLVVPPMVQLLVFAFATTLDVKNVDIGVLNRSSGPRAAEVVSQISGSPNVRQVVRLASPRDLADAIDEQRVLAAVVIDEDFDRRIVGRGGAVVGLVLDGRRSNAAQIVAGYLGQIVASAGAESQPQARPGTSVVRHWFNPSLDYIWFTLPSLIAIIVSIAGLALTSQTVARERELGTFEQLMVSPLRVHEILIGKMVPPILVGMLNGTLYLVVAPLAFGVPFTGSLGLFYLSLLVYLLALVGVGMLVSSVSQTQQQAFLGSFLITVPLMLLSGYASPIDNMPQWLQGLTYGNPARYFLVIVQGLFLKALPAASVLRQLWPMGVIACVTLAASAWMFRARME